jgi:hypothetical protein
VRKIEIVVPAVAVTALVTFVVARSWHGGPRVSPDGDRISETGSLHAFPPDPPSKDAAKAAPSLSLTASDGTGLKLASLDARGVVQGPLAFTEIRLAFDNPEDRTLEGTFRITLPQGAAISRFAMKQGDRWQEGEVVEKQAARRAYEDFLHRRQDPALLEQAAGNEFSARVFPIPGKGRKELIVSYSQEIGPEAPYVVALRGLPKVEKLDAVVSADRDDAALLGQIHLSNAVPDRDLTIDPTKMQPGEGLRAGELALVRVKPAIAAGLDPVKSAVFLVDTSASRALGFEAQIELLERVVMKLDPSSTIAVGAFDQGIDAVYQGPAAGFSPTGVAKLRERQALGASDLGGALEWARTKAAEIRATRVVLLGDGVPTRGTTEPAALREIAKSLNISGVERIDAIAVGGIRDDALLKQITTSGLAKEGVVIDGSRGAEVALRRLGAATRSGTVTVEGATWQWPLRLEGLQPGDEALVYAEVPKGTPVRVRFGDTPMREPRLTEVQRPLLERAWAQAKIQGLVLHPPEGAAEATKAEIVRLSTTHRVLSPYTALLVLETERDYERYKIDRKALADILAIDGTKLALRKRTEDTVLQKPTVVTQKGGDVPGQPADSDGVVLRAPAPRPPPHLVTLLPVPEPAPAASAMATAGAPGAPARAGALDQAQEFGMIGLLNSGAGGDPSKPSARGNMWGDEIGDSFGAGGLGLSGVGESGGRGEGIGLGSVGAIGHGAGTGTGQGFGSGHGRLGGRHRAKPPQVRMGATQVSGRLPPEVIQRIVRQNFGRFRLCYENGLRANPNLQGRVSVRFVIGRDGTISNVQNGGSDLPDSGVVSCVTRAFYGITFPQPEGGIVTVTYPILFTPGDVGPRPVHRPGPPPPPPPPPKPSFGPYEGTLAIVMEAIEKGDRDGALHKAVEAWKASPGDVMALVGLGEAFEARGEIRSAARAYGSIIDLFSSRADLRRMAGERLERLAEPYALSLAADSYAKAKEQRPDHPASHRLLAYARLRAGDPKGAFDAIEEGAKRSYPSGRFAGVEKILREDMGLIGAAWIKADPSKRTEVEDRLHAVGAVLEKAPSVRFVLNWETDNNDVDFHIHDAKGGHAYYSSKNLPSGGSLYADVTTGYGPECFTVPLPSNERSGPYRLQAHYYSRGPMGYGMGKLEIIDHDGQGGLTFEERPFVVMKNRAFVELGEYPKAKGEPAKKL